MYCYALLQVKCYKTMVFHVKVASARALGKGNERYEWVNEARIAPWVICVLRKEEKTLLTQKIAK